MDIRYQRGKIYTVRCYDDDTLIYVGSTIETLSARMSKHRYHNTCTLYQYVNGNWKNWYIELYEEYPCNNKQLLEKREGEIIRLIGTINKKIQGRTIKEYLKDNEKKIKQNRIDNKEKRKKYLKDNTEKIKKQVKDYNEANKEQISKQKKQYREANKENINEKAKEKVVCDHCGCEINKSNLKRHQQSKKCLKKQIS